MFSNSKQTNKQTKKLATCGWKVELLLLLCFVDVSIPMEKKLSCFAIEFVSDARWYNTFVPTNRFVFHRRMTKYTYDATWDGWDVHAFYNHRCRIRNVRIRVWIQLSLSLTKRNKIHASVWTRALGFVLVVWIRKQSAKNKEGFECILTSFSFVSLFRRKVRATRNSLRSCVLHSWNVRTNLEETRRDIHEPRNNVILNFFVSLETFPCFPTLASIGNCNEEESLKSWFVVPSYVRSVARRTPTLVWIQPTPHKKKITRERIAWIRVFFWKRGNPRTKWKKRSLS